MRRHQAVLCVHNLSRFAQPAELSLAKWAGSTPYEVLGRVPVPRHHRGAVHDHPAAVRVPLVRPGARGEARAGMTAERDQALRTLVEAWLGQRKVAPAGQIAVLRAEVLRAGRPGLVDIVAQVGERQAHLVAGLRGVHRRAALPVLRARRRRSACSTTSMAWPCAPTRCATRSWRRSCSPRSGASRRGRDRWRSLRDDEDATVLDCGDRGDLMVFPWLAPGPGRTSTSWWRWTRPGSTTWRLRWCAGSGRGVILGVVQEPLADRSGGWALAITSLRDFYATGGAPEAAGGDFGAEARALGTMTARMHLALDRAFLRAARAGGGLGRRGGSRHRGDGRDPLARRARAWPSS